MTTFADLGDDGIAVIGGPGEFAAVRAKALDMQCAL
jgi:hypothetical protein